VLVNKSHNKTPYELFNGRSPAIGFLKPFGCHVMILNTLDHLGKFKAKGDEGYFIRYSMYSKALRVFNKRTKRVEESLHVEFIENKAIENGAGPNWLFDIDSLTKSMNYVPVVAESSSSKPQDDCNTNVPESSGNFNPIATSTNPSADHIETLTGETSIPTNNESNGVEADVSNIETTITASPTPTLRIHKDHPKSQIIGPVDTLIQTRNKSKEVGEQSFIATIHQKTDPALLQFCLFSCFLSQVEPKKIFDALQDPSWVPEFPARVYKVEKEMHGLHQAPRAWYGTLSKYLLTNGFQSATIDQTLFIRRQRGDFILVQVYVDDIIFGSSNLQLCREFEALMHEKFQMSAMGELNFFLDLHQVTPKECHLHAVKRIFRYLKGHPKLGLWYPKESPFDLVVYSDSDYGGATQDRKSTTGGCQFFGRRLISWQCKKQTIVATSTIEAEYVASASCCGQVLWI
nr:hypothetical protein [Tanacetum cinerariifolium]